jgi:hypothetical protein
LEIRFYSIFIDQGWRFWHGLMMLKERCLSSVNRCFLGRWSVSQINVTFWEYMELLQSILQLTK